MDNPNTTAKETQARTMVAALSDEALCLAWDHAANQATTPEIAMVREWISDELLNRLGDDLFDQWLYAYDDNGNPISPLFFLAAR